MEAMEPPVPIVRKGQRRASTAVGLFSTNLLSEVEQDYPMLCFCDENYPCRFSCTNGHKGRLPLAKTILFGLPYFGWYSLSFFKKSTMKPFYTDDYPKASLGYIALFSVVGVIFDAFTDPFVASMTDGARPKIWGRRRPFVVVGGLMAIVVFLLSYTPLVPSGAASSIWFGVFHIGAKLVDTTLLIPLNAWGSEMTPNVNERSKLWTSREIFMTLGILFGSVLPSVVQNLGGTNCTKSPSSGCIGFPVLAFAFGFLCFLGCLLLSCYGGERPNERLPAPSKIGKAREPFAEDAIVPTLISTWLNRPFRCLILSDVAEAFGGYLPFVVLPYFTRVVLGDACMDPTTMFSILAGINLICRLLLLPVWVCAGRRYGKFNTYLVFNFMLAASQCLFFFIGKDDENCTMMPILLTATIIWGIVYGGSFFLRSIMADVADYDQFLSGKRREAQYVMALEFLPKFLEVPSEAIPFLLMAYFGYIRPDDDDDAVLPIQPQEVVWLMRFCVSIVPAVSILIGSIVLCFYPKEARTNEAHKALMIAIREKHAQGLPAEDPWLPGRILDPPPPPGLHDDVLAYFWPSELKVAFEKESQHSSTSLLCSTLKGIVIGTLLLPCGIALMIMGWEDLNSDLGASVSPIGVIFVGVGILFITFDGVRLRAAREIQRRAIPQSDYIARYKYLGRFTGSCDRANAPVPPEVPKEQPEKCAVLSSSEPNLLPNGSNPKANTPVAPEVANEEPNKLAILPVLPSEEMLPNVLTSSTVGKIEPNPSVETPSATSNGLFSV